MIIIEKKVGDTKIIYQSDKKDVKEDILNVSWLTSAPTKCGVCGSLDIFLEGHIARNQDGEQFVYCSYKCKECSSSLTLGTYKNGGLFLKSWYRYERTENQNMNSGDSLAAPERKKQKDDLPF